MKTLIMISMLVLMTACNGAGGGSASPEFTPTNNHNSMTLNFETHGTYLTAFTSEEFTVDEHRSLIIPEFITKTLDVNNSILMNDIARIKFVDSNCDYKWNGTQFAFFQCYGALAGNQWGDVIYLYDLTGFGNAALAGKVNLGTYRPGANHTGNIIIQTSL